MSYLIENKLTNQDLNARISTALKDRLRSSESYNDEEIRSVSESDTRLFPFDFRLPDHLGEDLRMVARFSQSELRMPSRIKSHRPIIGPFIVGLKRLLWPLIRAQLKDAFVQLEEFNSRILQLTAGLVAENDELKKHFSRK